MNSRSISAKAYETSCFGHLPTVAFLRSSRSRCSVLSLHFSMGRKLCPIPPYSSGCPYLTIQTCDSRTLVVLGYCGYVVLASRYKASFRFIVAVGPVHYTNLASALLSQSSSRATANFLWLFIHQRKVTYFGKFQITYPLLMDDYKKSRTISLN